jgi:predicted N-acetyltransferase YhbS
MAASTLRFKVASEPGEFEQIHRLNYETFVEEIPQHPPNAERRLVDRFHAENTYLIALHGPALAGMVAVRDRRPFSLDAKLADLDSYLPPHRSLCELRLLAVAPAHRGPRVLQGLMTLLATVSEARGYDLAVISGTVRQLRLYAGLGFTAFGPLVGEAPALFQPLYLTLASYQALKARTRAFKTLDCG